MTKSIPAKIVLYFEHLSRKLDDLGGDLSIKAFPEFHFQETVLKPTQFRLVTKACCIKMH